MTARNIKICKTVAKCFGLTVEQMLSKTRRQPIAFARQIAMALCWDHTGEWGPGNADCHIAAEFGCERTTITYARHSFCERRNFGTSRDRSKIALCEDAVRRAKL